MIRPHACVAMMILLASAASAEVLVMKSGRIVRAEVLKQTSRQITFLSGDGEVTLPRGEVSSVFSDAQYGEGVRTQAHANVPPPTRAALMEGTYEPGPEEKFATAMGKLEQSGKR